MFATCFYLKDLYKFKGMGKTICLKDQYIKNQAVVKIFLEVLMLFM